ncbi:MAG: sugar phosphate isomerase/epimerase [Saprospiraceae bacterium]|nr:sugar phosphate isomerase/epimerase [Saprospiraceae bacterium]MBK6480234.1 sugar phosphate isomerase/epimerase [Saprospiraceae bacterium]MBK7435584.1 sugar phosphate isomerase/epimerase [Saprospiraceae bacterium]MBK8281991.1 sugar phosphate isomerase/epimerase [Saprospiraceae bacterium]MBK8511186.1 sugar phosphate isomerase/epimerase [Saprospiraceae bacterium]
MLRRKFLESTTVGLMGMPLLSTGSLFNHQNWIMKSDISLAQWALVDEVKSGKWKNLDFPKIAREDFGLNGIEFVNTLFEVPTEGYLKKLKANAATHGVTMVLIMVDDEGDGASDTSAGRKQFDINHRKWIDIAHYLGCHAIRTNCRGPKDADKKEALKWAIESYSMLLDYAKSSGIKVVIENHGGVSNDPDWMVSLMKSINHPLFGTYPDWRSPSPEFDNVTYLEKMLPYAMGMSYRNQPTEELTARMIKMSKEGGYIGWYGIESTGRDAIHQGISLLKKYL